MKIEIHREERPHPITAVTLTIDVETLRALLDVGNYHITTARAISQKGSVDFSLNEEELERSLLRLFAAVPLDVKRELRRQS